MTSGQKMAIVAAQYRTDVTIFTPADVGQQLVLPRDPRRFFVEFRPVASSPYFLPIPSSDPSIPTAAPAETSPRNYKYHDSPGIVTGEWYVFPTTKVWSVIIITDTYIGD